MTLIVFLLAIFASGLIIGALARLALPGPDPMSLGQTALLGIAGSLGAGLITLWLIGRGAGVVFSVLGATVILYFVRRSRGGGLARPGRG